MSNPVPTIKFAGVTVPDGLNRKDLFKFMKENKATLIAEKKAALKRAEALTIPVDITGKYIVDTTGKITKASPDFTPQQGGPETVLCVINTTNWMDSHSDVHIPGIWNKSIKDHAKTGFLHLQEHKMSFTHIISDNSKGYVQSLTWKELGLDVFGITEALIFETQLTGRNPYMEDQYRKGYVKNHSVGMQYVLLEMCINEPEDRYWKEEYEAWEKYLPMVVNVEEAEAQGFFWAVTEAKIAEGSAVPMGSNIITPTRGFKSVQPEDSTEQKQPEDSTVVKEDKPLEGGEDFNIKQLLTVF